MKNTIYDTNHPTARNTKIYTPPAKQNTSIIQAYHSP